MIGLVVLGSTGSIGRQTLDIVRSFPSEFRIIGLAAGSQSGLLKLQIEEFKPQFAFCSSAECSESPLDDVRYCSMEDMVSQPDVDMVMAATVGIAGLKPTLRALENKKTVALANKEVIIIGGEMLMTLVHPGGGSLLPVDSEPSAIWQCLQGENQSPRRIIITASGGPFRSMPMEQMEDVTPEQALKHPTWNMGKKITIDSATLMNKAFEVLEAHWLFGTPWENIEVVLHKQSIIHSMVEFADGSIKAQMGPPDMRLPIQYAMFNKIRLRNDSIPRLDTGMPHTLDFQPMNNEHYPCFTLGVDAGKKGGTYPAALSAADEVAVELFLNGKIGFMDIYRTLEGVLTDHMPCGGAPTLEDILDTDKWARRKAHEIALSLP